MRHQELVDALRTQPFRPFRIHVSDGASYEVRHPDLVWVALAYAVVGAPAAADVPPRIQRHDVVDLSHITRLEQMETPTSPSTS